MAYLQPAKYRAYVAPRQSLEAFADPRAGYAKQKGGWPEAWPATLGERIHDILSLLGADDRQQWCLFGFEANRAFTQQLEDVAYRYQASVKKIKVARHPMNPA